MVNLVKNHMAEAYEKEKREIIEKEKKEKEMIEKEKKETIEKVEKEKSEEQEEMNEMINALVTKERHANDKVGAVPGAGMQETAPSTY